MSKKSNKFSPEVRERAVRMLKAKPTNESLGATERIPLVR